MKYAATFISAMFLVAHATKMQPSEDSTEVLYGTPLGTLKGTLDYSRGNRSYYSFRSIRYAMAPIGNLRFANPVPYAKWPGILDATVDAPLCIQKNYLIKGAPTDGVEDCLFLNIFTPKLPNDSDNLLPVLLVIHGGGFFSGTGSILGPKYFMDHDVLLVTFNYRLGPFGFFSTGDGAASGNWGLKDQVVVMHWVQKYIHYFGGDKNLVTIMGQSAGGASVHYHLLTQSFNGLFHHAISQSGTALSLWAQPFPAPKEIAKAQAAFLDCSDIANSVEIVRCLRGKSAEELVNSGDSFKFWDVDPLNIYTPVIEYTSNNSRQAYLTEHPYDIIRSRNFRYIPWLLGSAQNEAGIRTSAMFSNKGLVDDLTVRFDSIGPQLLELEYSVPALFAKETWKNITDYYIGSKMFMLDTDEDNFNNMFGDRAFTYATHQSINLHSRAYHTDIFLYHLNYKGNQSYCVLYAGNKRVKDYGACHCDDLLLLHDPHLLPFTYIDAHHPDYIASEFLVNVFVQFSTNGNPGLNYKWPAVSIEFDSDYPISGRIHYMNITKQLSKEYDTGHFYSGFDSEHGTAIVVSNLDDNDFEETKQVVYSSSPVQVVRQVGFYEDRMRFWESLSLAENMKYSLSIPT